MDGEWERQPGALLDLGGGSRLTVVAIWWGPEGAELRVVRWQLRSPVRELYHWARGQAFATGTADDDEDAEPWVAGVALERRDSPTARWATIQRQELSGAEPAQFAARLRGWEAGLLDRAEKMTRVVKRL
jgi:hypothetical protein